MANLPVSRSFIYLLVFIVGAGLAIILSVPIFSRVKTSWDNFSVTKKKVDLMSLKKDSLANLDANSVESAAVSGRALPLRVGAVSALARIREVAQSVGVSVSKVQLSTKEDVVPQANVLTISVVGGVSDVRKFLEEAQNTLPLVKIGEGKITTSGGPMEATVDFETFWQPAPKLPGIEEALPVLTGEEKNLLDKLKTFKGATAVSGQSSSYESRPNPFSF